MKSTFIYIFLFLAICASVYFTYQRSFVTRDFEVVNSEEEFEEVPEEEITEELMPEESPVNVEEESQDLETVSENE